MVYVQSVKAQDASSIFGKDRRRCRGSDRRSGYGKGRLRLERGRVASRARLPFFHFFTSSFILAASSSLSFLMGKRPAPSARSSLPAAARHATPPQAPLMGDTPAKPRAVHSSSYRRSALGSRRLRAVKDLEHAVEIGYEKFRDLCLPTLPHGVDVATVSSIVDRNCHWLPFEESLASSESENQTFGHLRSLFDETMKATKKRARRKQLFCLDTTATVAPTTDGRTSTFKNDAYFKFKDASSSPLSWYDVGLPAECKKLDQPQKREDVSCLSYQRLASLISSLECLKDCLRYAAYYGRRRLSEVHVWNYYRESHFATLVWRSLNTCQEHADQHSRGE